MPIKEFLHRFQPAPLYIVLALSICYFSVQLLLSHITHALTLLMSSYHMLCNIFALAGSIVTVKHNEINDVTRAVPTSSLATVPNEVTKPPIVSMTRNDSLPPDQVRPPTVGQQLADEECNALAERKRRELKTRNTFGWARIEILTMLIVCITLASLSFSLLVEALQTLVHIDHQDSMHLPIHVMILGLVGLLLNGFTYLLIGGYTMHQGSFLHITRNGNVVLERATISRNCAEATLTKGSTGNDQQLRSDLKAEVGRVHYATRRQGAAELLRDVSSTIFVIVCGLIVHFAEDKEHTAKFIDPILSIFSCMLVVGLSYPYMKESCLILLQTIPDTIDMENFERTLVAKFPQIVSFHDLHIWQLSTHKYVATVHIIFENPKLYAKTIEEIRSHFYEHRIAHVTIQPEFRRTKNASSWECLVQCTKPDCADKVCCRDSLTDLREISVCHDTSGRGGGGGGGGNESHGRESRGKSHKQSHSHHGHAHTFRYKYDSNQKYGHNHGHNRRGNQSQRKSNDGWNGNVKQQMTDEKREDEVNGKLEQQDQTKSTNASSTSPPSDMQKTEDRNVQRSSDLEDTGCSTKC